MEDMEEKEEDKKRVECEEQDDLQPDSDMKP